jgi:hypothetical protein
MYGVKARLVGRQEYFLFIYFCQFTIYLTLMEVISKCDICTKNIEYINISSTSRHLELGLSAMNYESHYYCSM